MEKEYHDLEAAFEGQEEGVVIDKDELTLNPNEKEDNTLEKPLVEEKEKESIVNDDDDSSTYYSGLYAWFKEENLLPISENDIKEYLSENNIDIDINSNEGFKAVIGANIDHLAEQKLKQTFSFLTDNQITDFIETMTNGGKLADFATLYQENDWETINVKNNIANQKRVIKEYYSRQGEDKDFIDSMIDTFESSKQLEKMAERFKSSIAKQVIQERENKKEILKQQYELEQQKAELEQQRFLATLKTTDNIANIPIDERLKDVIYDFKYKEKPLYEDMAQTIPYMIDGQHVHVTPLEFALYNETPEQTAIRELLVAYLVVNNYDLSGVTKKIRTKEISSLEKAMKNVPKGKNTSTSKNNDLESNWR